MVPDAAVVGLSEGDIREVANSQAYDDVLER